MDDTELQSLMDAFVRVTQTAREQLEQVGPLTLGTADAQRRLRYLQLLQSIEGGLPYLGAAYGQALHEGLLREVEPPTDRLRSLAEPADPDLNALMLDLQHDWVDVVHPLESIGKWPPTMRSIGPWPPRTGTPPTPAPDEGNVFDSDRMLSIGKWPQQ